VFDKFPNTGSEASVALGHGLIGDGRFLRIYWTVR